MKAEDIAQDSLVRLANRIYNACADESFNYMNGEQSKHGDVIIAIVAGIKAREDEIREECAQVCYGFKPDMIGTFNCCEVAAMDLAEELRNMKGKNGGR